MDAGGRFGRGCDLALWGCACEAGQADPATDPANAPTTRRRLDNHESDQNGGGAAIDSNNEVGEDYLAAISRSFGGCQAIDVDEGPIK